jgi:hypothetical protein
VQGKVEHFGDGHLEPTGIFLVLAKNLELDFDFDTKQFNSLVNLPELITLLSALLRGEVDLPDFVSMFYSPRLRCYFEVAEVCEKKTSFTAYLRSCCEEEDEENLA